MKVKPIIIVLALLGAVVIWGIVGFFSRPDVNELQQNRDVEGLVRALEYEDNPILALVGLGGRGYEILVRAEAAHCLGEIGDTRAVEPLIQALSYRGKYGFYWQVRMNAANALGEIGDARAVEPLIQALWDPQPQVQLSAANALGKIGDARAVKPLIRRHSEKEKDPFLFDEYTDIQIAAREALVKIGGEAAAEYFIQAGDRESVVRIGEAAVEPLIQTLESEEEDWGIRALAADALGKIGDTRAERALVAAMTQDSGVRGAAAVALTEMYKDDISKLLGYLENRDTALAVYRALIEMGKPGTEDALIEVLVRFGDKEMAIVYLNCGNKKLEEAGKEWAAAHGYAVISLSVPGGTGGTSWGGQ